MLTFEKRPSWLRLVFSWRGSPLARIRYRLLFVLVVSEVLTYWHETFHIDSPVTLQALALLGVALGIFLGFRNNAAYDRFWEGRKLWGRLVNVSRALSRNLVTFWPTPEPSDAARSAVYQVIAFVHALRMQLRDQMDSSKLAPLLNEAQLTALRGAKNVPNALLLQLGRELAEWRRSGAIGEYAFVELSRQLADLNEIQGGCERIKNSPIPYSYTVVIHQIVALYVVILPFGLVGSLHYMTPVMVMFIAYTFLGLDAVGDEIEEPFGEDLNDLPLATISQVIEINLRETLGEKDLPTLPAPVDGVLL
jgi:putative membrane protein